MRFSGNSGAMVGGSGQIHDPQIYDHVGGETDMKRDHHKVFLGLMHLPL